MPHGTGCLDVKASRGFKSSGVQSALTRIAWARLHPAVAPGCKVLTRVGRPDFVSFSHAVAGPVLAVQCTRLKGSARRGSSIVLYPVCGMFAGLRSNVLTAPVIKHLDLIVRLQPLQAGHAENIVVPGGEIRVFVRREVEGLALAQWGRAGFTF